MVAYCVEFVFCLFGAHSFCSEVGLAVDSLLDFLLFVAVHGSLVDEVGGEVEAHGEDDLRFVLFLSVGALLLESLEVEDQDLGGL